MKIQVALLIIIGILLFELIIFFHEGGHYLAAKRSGVKVNEFALGMGPKLFSFQKGETLYSLRLLPIGGFCAMEGEDEDSENPRSFNNAKIWKRMIIIIAGAVMNIIFGFILMMILLGQQEAFSSTTIEAFSENSYSANSGLQANDQIVRVNNYNVNTAKDLSFAISTMKVQEVNGGELNIYKQDAALELCHLYKDVATDKIAEDKIELMSKSLKNGTAAINAAASKEDALSILNEYYAEINSLAGIADYKLPEITEQQTRQRYRTDIDVIRNGKKVTLSNVDFYTYLSQTDTEEEPVPSVGIDFYVKPIEKNVLTLITQSFNETVSVVRMVWSSLVGIIQGQYSFKEISGPIGATSAISQVASAGLESGFGDAVNNIIFMMMVISVNLGIVNMLPFPALDGGRFVFLLIEAIRRKPVPRKYEAYVNGAGMALLLIFMAVISVKDIWQLFGG